MKIWKKYVDDNKWVFPEVESMEDFIRRTEGHGHWAEGTALKELKENGIVRTPYALYFDTFPLPFKNRWVNRDSIQVDGVDSRDYPDFCDAYLSEAQWSDGTDLTEDELAELDESMPELSHELAIESFI